MVISLKSRLLSSSNIFGFFDEILTLKLSGFNKYLTSFNETKHRVFHLMQSGDELHAIVIRNAEILTQDSADGVNWLDGQRHLLQEFDAINRHTIALSGDLIHSTVE